MKILLEDGEFELEEKLARKIPLIESMRVASGQIDVFPLERCNMVVFEALCECMYNREVPHPYGVAIKVAEVASYLGLTDILGDIKREYPFCLTFKLLRDASCCEWGKVSGGGLTLFANGDVIVSFVGPVVYSRGDFEFKSRFIKINAKVYMTDEYDKSVKFWFSFDKINVGCRPPIRVEIPFGRGTLKVGDGLIVTVRGLEICEKFNFIYQIE